MRWRRGLPHSKGRRCIEMLDILPASSLSAGALGLRSAPSAAPVGVSEGARGYLAFMLAGQALVTDLSVVREVLVLGETFQLAHLPAFVRGIADVRGEAVPMIDLRMRLGLPSSANSFILGPAHQVAILLEWTVAQGHGKRVIGVLVDSVQDVVYLDDATLAPLPELPFAQAAPYLSGLVRQEGEWLVRLDLQKLLSADELAAAAAAAASAAMVSTAPVTA